MRVENGLGSSSRVYREIRRKTRSRKPEKKTVTFEAILVTFFSLEQQLKTTIRSTGTIRRINFQLTWTRRQIFFNVNKVISYFL